MIAVFQIKKSNTETLQMQITLTCVECQYFFFSYENDKKTFNLNISVFFYENNIII